MFGAAVNQAESNHADKEDKGSEGGESEEKKKS